MRLGLVQTTHSPMCNFLSTVFPYSPEDCRCMQREQIQQNLQLLETVAGSGYDLLVTTECINYIRTGTGNAFTDAALYPTLEQAVVPLAQAAAQAHSWLVAGVGFQQQGHTYNGALVFDRQGNLRTIYRKIHLAGDEKLVFTPGSRFGFVQADFGLFGVCICWDMQFPETARLLTLLGARLIVCPTWGWEANLYGRARAYENGIFTAAAMAVPAWGPIESPRTPSSVIGPDGHLLVCGSATKAEIVTCELDLTQAEGPRQTRLADRRPELYSFLTYP